VIEYLLKAVDTANRSGERRTGVPDSVVKRIESISLSPLDVPDPNAASSGAPSAPTSITGRQSGGGNGLYDIRNAKMSVIVSSAKLPQFFDAISRTNFMSVTGLYVEDVDEWAELENGYYYGSEHVVRAVVDIETVWLRSWMSPLMPPDIRNLLVGAQGMDLAATVPAPAPEAAVMPTKPSAGGSTKKGKSTRRPGATKSGDGGF
jgi:hypothetical protein